MSSFEMVSSIDISTVIHNLGNMGNGNNNDMRQTVIFKKVDSLDLTDIYYSPKAADPGEVFLYVRALVLSYKTEL